MWRDQDPVASEWVVPPMGDIVEYSVWHLDASERGKHGMYEWLYSFNGDWHYC